MKNILSNKKWLNIITLLFLVISLSSCSATSYWWGIDWEGIDLDKETPFEAFLSAITAPIFSLFSNEFNLVTIIVGVFWLFGLSSAIQYLYGSSDDIRGVKTKDVYKPNSLEKVCTITDYSEAYTVAGSGTKERGHSRANNTISFFLFLLPFLFIFKLILGWFDDLNMLFVIIIGAISAILSIFIYYGILSQYKETFKYVCWYFCAVDFVLGIIVTLWNTTV